MPKTPLFGLTQFRAWLLTEGLSPSTAEAYVKQVRRALSRLGKRPTKVELDAYDATLTVKLRENFRAAWRRLVIYLGAEWPLPAPPMRAARTTQPKP